MRPLRGVVEGYYGRPWSGVARRDVVAHLGARGMTAFVYGPKHDPWHRERWREPYPAAALEDLAATARAAHAAGMRFVWAVSPGHDLRAGDDDRAALHRKLAQVSAAGVVDVALFLDDLPDAPPDAGDGTVFAGAAAVALAGAHAALANDVDDWLRARHGHGLALVVPSDYAGTRPSAYLATLTAALAADVPLGWTGPAVLSARIGADEARARREHTGGRGVVLWDNWPVNDVVLANSLHLGPLTGRDAALAAALDGHLFNPMRQPYASLVPLSTAADWLRDPAAYVPEASWAAALAALEPGGALAVLARQTCSSVLSDPDWADATDLARAVDAAVGAWPTRAWAAAVDAVDAEYARHAGAAASLGARAADVPIVAEVAPWTAELARHAAEGRAACALLRALRAPDADAGRLATACAAPAVPDLGTYVSALGDLLGPDIATPAALGLNVHGKAFYVVPRSFASIDVVTGHNVHHRFLGFVAGEAARAGHGARMPQEKV